MNALLAFGDSTATTIDWTALTSTVTVTGVIDLIQSAFPLIAVAVMCSIVVGVILWGVGMIKNIF